MSAPFASVVVPTRGRATVLADCLETLVAQDHPADRFEIVVVANGPPDGSAERVRAARCEDGPDVRLVELLTPDANGARNAGFRAARGELLCLVDDDVLAPPEWLRELVAGAERNPGAECLGGPVRARFEDVTPRTCARHQLAGNQLDRGPLEGETDEVWGCNMAVRRSAIERVGPFRERLPLAHEAEWEERLQQAGGRIVWLPEAWLWHRRLRSDLRLLALVRQYFLLGLTLVRIGHPAPTGPTLRNLRFTLGHALRTRCARGLTDAARYAGMACGIVSGQRRRVRRAGLSWPARIAA